MHRFIVWLLGYYTSVEWLSRREKWNSEVTKTTNEITDLKRQLKSISLVQSEDKLSSINTFLESIETATTPKERNELYMTIIDKIIWTRTGVDTKIEIVYK